MLTILEGPLERSYMRPLVIVSLEEIECDETNMLLQRLLVHNIICKIMMR